jgi:hypothetical protein
VVVEIALIANCEKIVVVSCFQKFQFSSRTNENSWRVRAAPGILGQSSAKMDKGRLENGARRVFLEKIYVIDFDKQFLSV